MNLILNHEGFDNCLVKRTLFNGIQYIFKFENGYGASVVKHFGSYGHDKGLWELAVLKFDGDEWHLCYDTEITDDVIRYLTDEEVRELLGDIKVL